LSFVNAAAVSDAEVESVGVAALELVLSLAFPPPEEASLPQAARESPRAEPRATVAESRLNRRVAVVDRFTL
jgi:hypothetical protein